MSKFTTAVLLFALVLVLSVLVVSASAGAKKKANKANPPPPVAAKKKNGKGGKAKGGKGKGGNGKPSKPNSGNGNKGGNGGNGGNGSKGKKGKVVWGALVGSQFTGSEAPGDWNAVKKFEKVNAGGKKLTVYHHGGHWHAGGCGGYCRFDSVGLGNIVKNGAVPVYAWGATSDDASLQPSFYNAAVAAGSQDAYIRQWAQDAKAFQHKIVLAPNWEMNGDWYPWSPKVGGASGTAADFIAAWRRIHSIIRSEVGASNVLFAFVPNIDPDNWWSKLSGYSLSAIYPGNDVVDYVGLDGYNGGTPWKSFADLFGPSYRALLQISGNKPFIILEIGCTERGGNKAGWIKDMFAVIPKSFSKIKMFMWYNRHSLGPGNNYDWSVESSKASQKAFAKGIKDQYYK